MCWLKIIYQQFINQPLEIESSLAALRSGEHIKISIAAFDLASNWYVISNIKHSFNLNSDSGYKNQVELLRTSAIKAKPLQKYSANNIAMAKIIASNDQLQS